MIEPTTRIAEACDYVCSFKVRQLFEHLLWREPGGQQIENIDDANSHTPHTGPPAALLRVHRDPIGDFHHGGLRLRSTIRVAPIPHLRRGAPRLRAAQRIGAHPRGPAAPEHRDPKTLRRQTPTGHGTPPLGRVGCNALLGGGKSSRVACSCVHEQEIDGEYR